MEQIKPNYELLWMTFTAWLNARGKEELLKTFEVEYAESVGLQTRPICLIEKDSRIEEIV